MPGLEDVLTGSTTFADATTLTKRIRHLLEDEPWQDTLSGSYTAGAGTITLSNPTKWAEGNIIDPDDGTAALLRVSATPSGNPVSVQASWNGTVDSNHSSGIVVFKNPRFTNVTISDALTAVIASDLPPNIYTTKIATLVPSASQALYALPSDFVDLVRNGVVQQTSGTITDVYYYCQGAEYQLLRNVPSGLAASTAALRFLSLGNLAHNIYVFYRAPITITTVPDDDIAELVVHLACARILRAKEVPLGGSSLTHTAANDVIQSGHLRADANSFQGRAIELYARIKAQLRKVNPPEARYVKRR